MLKLSMATLPKDYNGIVYQIIRPTGLLDPIVEVRPSLPETFESLKQNLIQRGFGDMPIISETSWTQPQVPNLIEEIDKTVEKK